MENFTSIGCLSIFRSFWSPQPAAPETRVRRSRASSAASSDQDELPEVVPKKSDPRKKKFAKFKWRALKKRSKPPESPSDNTMRGMSRHFLFSKLSPEERNTVLTNMQPFVFDSQAVLITEEKRIPYCYFIEKGKVDCFRGGNYLESLGPGDSIGEYSLLIDNAFSEDTCIVADVEPLSCWRLDRRTYVSIVSNLEIEQLETILDLLGNVFGDLDRVNVELLARSLEHSVFGPGQLIISEGEASVDSSFFIVQQGGVVISRVSEAGLVIGKLEQGMYFGEGRLLCPSRPRLATVTAGPSGVVCLSLDLRTHKPAPFIPHLRNILETNFCSRVMRPVLNLEDAPGSIIQELARVLEGVWFSDGENISADCAIVVDGEVEVTSHSGKKKRLTTGMFFGLEIFTCALDPARRDHVTIGNASATAVGAVRCVVATEDQISARVRIVTDTFAPFFSAPKISKEEDVGKLEELGTLGFGSFGKVKLMKWGSDGALVAVKQLRKVDIAQKGSDRFAKLERDVLSLLRHPFVVKLYTTFTDDKYICFVLEYIPGKDLYHRLRNVGKFPERESKMYAGMISLALAYLHSQKVCYRDLKPENLMIDNLGYLKLVDFGMSCVSVSKTFTRCGTLEYMAPELLLGSGYTQTVDVWGLGVCLFEMISGRTPFSVGETDLAVVKNIVAGRFKFEIRPSAECEDLIQKLLSLDPKRRLGCGKNGWQEVKEHPFFQEIDWKKLEAKELTAPWIPPTEDPMEIVRQNTEAGSAPLTPTYTGSPDLFSDWDTH